MCSEACPCGCVRPHFAARPGTPLDRNGDEIMAAGQLFHTGTRVVLWTDPKGYNAYNAEPFLRTPGTQPAREPRERQHYNTRGHLPNALGADVATHGWTLANLQEQVDQFVIHYDVCGTSRRCFEVLHDAAILSVPFMLDVDGTIYQTLDLKERAWHAAEANDRSIGVEIAHMGTYSKPEDIQKYYATSEQGWPYFVLPARESGVLTPGYIPYSARTQLISGKIHGRTLYQYDYTNEQYAALSHLIAALHVVLPKMKIDVPRNLDGSVRTTVLSKEERLAWSGLMGHYHVTTQKIDPGPAFDWDRVITCAKGELGM